MTASLSQAKLLLQMLHRDPPLATREQLARLPIEELADLVAAARVTRLSFQYLQWLNAHPECLARMPVAAMQDLRKDVRRVFAANCAHQDYLRKLVDACAAESVPIIAIKGLWLAEIAYRDIAARAPGDIDVLVEAAAMPRFTRLVKSLGFKVPEGVDDIREIAPLSNEFPLNHGKSKAGFDVHWSLTRQVIERDIDDDAIWRRAERWPMAGGTCTSLCVEDHLLYVCFHIANHHRFEFVGPRALLDVATLIEQPPRPIDWDDVIARAHERGWARGAWLVFELVREQLGTQPPQRVIDALAPGDASVPGDATASVDALEPGYPRLSRGAPAADVRAAALDALLRPPPEGGAMSIWLVRLHGERSLWGRVKLLVDRVFPAREEIATQFQLATGARALPLYYVVRWGRLISAHGTRVLRMVGGDNALGVEARRAALIERWIEG